MRGSWTRGCPDSRTIIIGRTPRRADSQQAASRKAGSSKSVPQLRRQDSVWLKCSPSPRIQGRGWPQCSVQPEISAQRSTVATPPLTSVLSGEVLFPRPLVGTARRWWALPVSESPEDGWGHTSRIRGRSAPSSRPGPSSGAYAPLTRPDAEWLH